MLSGDSSTPSGLPIASVDQGCRTARSGSTLARVENGCGACPRFDQRLVVGQLGAFAQPPVMLGQSP